MPVANALISKPLIDETYKGVDTPKTNGCCILVSELFYGFGVAASAFRMDLADMIALVLLRVLFVLFNIVIDFEAVTLILPISLQKSQNRNNATSNVQKMKA